MTAAAGAGQTEAAMDERASGPRTGDAGAALSRRGLLRRGGVAALAPLLSGCETPAFFEKATDDRVLIEMTAANRFEPATVTVPLGTTVVWRNASPLPHTASCDPAEIQNPALAQLPGDAPAWRSGDVYPGETWALTFEVRGTYVYSCRFHGEAGMVGTITVTA